MLGIVAYFQKMSFQDPRKKYGGFVKGGHEWQSIIYNRVKGVGCPICANKQVLTGYNDLETISPSLAKEWSYERNGSLLPTTVTTNSNKKVWWICSVCGYEWSATIDHRSRRGQGCPRCNVRNHTSFPEQALFFYIRQCHSSAVNGYRGLFPNSTMELDIYIPEIKTGIEYDGAIWHRNTLSSERDKKKYDICVGAGIRLIRIKERIPSKQINAEIANADHVICIENPNNYKQLDAVIQQMSRFFTMPSIINTAKDSSAILASSRAIVRNDSLAVIYPQIALEWNHARNGHLVPAMCTKASADLVWWKCKKGHEYQMRIYSRVAGSGCPYCAGKKILIGENDLATTNPELINEWDNNRNNPLTPQSVTSGTAREVWWICKKGHCWKARIQNRVRGIGCPYCSGRYAIKGINDLATINPDIAQKWHPTKNGSLKPDEVLPNSEKRVWWLCENGHEWENTVANMKNGNCPKCMKEKSSRKRTEKRVELPYDGFTQKK